MSRTIRCPNKCRIECYGETMISEAYISDLEDDEVRCKVCGRLLWKPKVEEEERIDYWNE